MGGDPGAWKWAEPEAWPDLGGTIGRGGEIEGCGLGGRGFQAMAHVDRAWRWGLRRGRPQGVRKGTTEVGFGIAPGLAWWGVVWGMA